MCEFNENITFIIAGPSGVGKATIIRRILDGMPNLQVGKSFTSRTPRPDDDKLNKYHFVSNEEFENLIRDGAFAEWARVHGHYYGTPCSTLEEAGKAGRDLVLELDVQGAKSIKAVVPEAVLIFVCPPGMDILERRLRGRSPQPEKEIQKRLATAKKELEEVSHFQYLVVNDNLDQAVEKVKCIVTAERLKTWRAFSARR